MHGLKHNNSLWEKYLSSFFISPWLLMAVVVVGAVLRLEGYLDNPSFWLDETYVATQITSRSFAGICSNYALMFGQPESPMVFSLLAKCSSVVFGNHELALRLIPFLSASLALVLLAIFLRRFYSPIVALLATALFAVSQNLIYFAAELKTYSGDVLAAVLALWLFEWARKQENARLAFLRSAYLGSLLLLFSNVTLFFLPWIFIMLWLKFRKAKNSNAKIMFVLLLWLWAMTFLYLHFSVYSVMTGDKDLVGMWQNLEGFSSKALLSWGWWKWFFSRYVVLAKFLLPGVWPALTLGLGLVGLVRLTGRDVLRSICVAGPIDLVLLAAILSKYPFYDRMILFFAPSLFICIGEGVEVFFKAKSFVKQFVFLSLIAVLLGWNVHIAAQRFFSNDEKRLTDNREVLQYLSRNLQSGDQIMFNTEAFFPFSYYFTTDMFSRFHILGEGKAYRVGCLRIDDSARGMGKKGEFRYIIEESWFAGSVYLNTFFDDGFYKFSAEAGPAVKSGRAWLFLSHIRDPLLDVIGILDLYGERVQGFEGRGARVYLYEMR